MDITVTTIGYHGSVHTITASTIGEAMQRIEDAIASPYIESFTITKED